MQKKFLDFPPALVVEILSPATAMKDRNNKFSLYEAQKIPYYIIVDADKQEIEIYSLKEGKYENVIFKQEDFYTFHLTEDCSPQITLAEIWN